HTMCLALFSPAYAPLHLHTHTHTQPHTHTHHTHSNTHKHTDTHTHTHTHTHTEARFMPHALFGGEQGHGTEGRHDTGSFIKEENMKTKEQDVCPERDSTLRKKKGVGSYR